MPDSPQAIIRNGFKRKGIREPQNVTLAAIAVEVYNKNTEPQVIKMYVHNVGITAVKYSMNQAATSTVYHDVLAAGSVADDGLGSGVWFDFTDVAIDSFSLFADAGSGKVAITKYIQDY